MKLLKDLALGEASELCRTQEDCKICPLCIERRNEYEDCFAHRDANFYTSPDL